MTTNNKTDGQGFAGLKQFAADVLSGWIFLGLFLATNNFFLSACAALATGVGQVIWMIWRKQKIDAMQWMVMAMMVGLSAATVVTHDPTFLMFKPSLIETGIAAVMLWPGWMARYLPPRARELIPPGLIFFWGYVYAAAWFALAASNLLVAYTFGLKAWAIYANFAPIVLMGVLWAPVFLVFRSAARRTARQRDIALSSPPVG